MMQMMDADARSNRKSLKILETNIDPDYTNGAMLLIQRTAHTPVFYGVTCCPMPVAVQMLTGEAR